MAARTGLCKNKFRPTTMDEADIAKRVLCAPGQPARRRFARAAPSDVYQSTYIQYLGVGSEEYNVGWNWSATRARMLRFS